MLEADEGDVVTARDLALQGRFARRRPQRHQLLGGLGLLGAGARGFGEMLAARGFLGSLFLLAVRFLLLAVFSRRLASSSPSGTRFIIQRSIGGIAMVVTTAMATIMV
jgi:hypothetical protein